jgi:hypothetical protein
METVHRNDLSQGLETFIRISLKSERLSTNIKLTLHTALIRSIMTQACPTWELAAETYLLKLQRMQNKFLPIIAIFPRCTPVHDLLKASSLP